MKVNSSLQNTTEIRRVIIVYELSQLANLNRLTKN